MDIRLFSPLLIALVFGVVVAAVEILIVGSPWAWRGWLARAWVSAYFAYIVLFGVIKVP